MTEVTIEPVASPRDAGKLDALLSGYLESIGVVAGGALAAL
jgi:hypothetical protein